MHKFQRTKDQELQYSLYKFLGTRILTLYHTMKTFDTAQEGEKPFEKIVEKKKRLLTCIFFFFRHVFYDMKSKFNVLSNILFVLC